MIENAVYALCCWILGFVVAVKTDWVVKQAVAVQRRYPAAFTLRMAERTWYPTFLRVLGVLLLVLAAIFTFPFFVAVVRR